MCWLPLPCLADQQIFSGVLDKFTFDITRSVVPEGALNDKVPDPGYMVDLRIPWSGIDISPEQGKIMGADFALNNVWATGFQYDDWASLDTFV